MKVASAFLISIVLSLPFYAQSSESDFLSEIRRLAAEEDWQEVVRVGETRSDPSAEVLYYYGVGLARLERWDDAEKALERGRSMEPRDKRFPLEIAGIKFRQKEYEEAADRLHRALRLDPGDEYANDFLGSVYFLQENLEAALKYWNRVSKPRVELVRPDPSLKVDPVLLDSAFEFAPASILRLEDLLTTEARVGGLGIFPVRRFELEARPGGRFDVVFRARERNGFGASKWQGLVSMLRGLPFQTVHPEYYNINGRAVNVIALIRWDAEKRRFRANLSGPLSGGPKRRYYFDVDWRDENWDIRAFSDDNGRLGDLRLRKQAVSAGVESFESGRWNWSTGVELSYRRLPEVSSDTELPAALLGEGLQLKHMGRLDYVLARVPERRITVRSGVSTELGRAWSGPSGTFAKLQGMLEAHWFPMAAGDDLEMLGRIRVGNTVGEIPFDELFVLGVERDNDLWLRAHSGTRNGRKGNAPMGRNYFLSNWEVDKIVLNRSLINVKLGPFLDIGRTYDSLDRLGSKQWLWDLGLQAKVGVLGQKVRFSYGRDLRTGGDVFYITFR